MGISTVLFDLDGTLLPMDMDKFIKSYFENLNNKMSGFGYKEDELYNALWLGIKAMIANNGTKTNEEIFWEKFVEIFGTKAIEDKALFDDFYKNDFDKIRSSCSYASDAKEIVHKLKSSGFRVVLATNPVFPAVATEQRIRWAGLEPSDFEFITTYENSCYCKPNTRYYSSILKTLNISPEECLMVGNNVDEDMIAEMLGIKVFLLTDCLINKSRKDVSKYSRGSFEELSKFLFE